MRYFILIWLLLISGCGGGSAAAPAPRPVAEAELTHIANIINPDFEGIGECRPLAVSHDGVLTPTDEEDVWRLAVPEGEDQAWVLLSIRKLFGSDWAKSYSHLELDASWDGQLWACIPDFTTRRWHWHLLDHASPQLGLPGLAQLLSVPDDSFEAQTYLVLLLRGEGASMDIGIIRYWYHPKE